jgi:pyrroloquinoline quinone biosynthesis protein D
MNNPFAWSPGARPRLASKVRLRWDSVRGKAMLLYPEGILVLNPTAQAVLELCDGQRTLQEIVKELARRFDGSAGGEARQGATSGRPTEGESEAAGTDIALNTDTITGGTSDADQPSIVAGPGSEERVSTEPESSVVSIEERERMVERDVKAFLDRVLQRGWITMEEPEGVSADGS